MITKCEKCNSEFEIEEQIVGTEVECSNCNNVFLAKQKLTLKTGSFQVSNNKIDDDDDDDDDEWGKDSFNSMHNRLRKREMEPPSLIKSMLFLIFIAILSVPIGGGLGGLVGMFFPPAGGVLASCIIYACFAANSLFLATRILGPQDNTAGLSIGASWSVAKWIFGIPALLASVMMLAMLAGAGGLVMLLLPFLMFYSFGFPLVLIIVQILVYQNYFQKTALNAFLLAIVQNIITLVFGGILMGIIGAIVFVIMLVSGGASLLENLKMEDVMNTFSSNNLQGSNLTIHSTDPNNEWTTDFEEEKKVAQVAEKEQSNNLIESLTKKVVSTVKDEILEDDRITAVNLFAEDGIKAGYGVNVNNINKFYGKNPFSKLNFGDNYISYHVARTFSFLDFYMGNNNTQGLDKYTELSNKLSNLMHNKKLSQDVLDKIEEFKANPKMKLKETFNDNGYKMSLEKLNSTLRLIVYYFDVNLWDYENDKEMENPEIISDEFLTGKWDFISPNDYQQKMGCYIRYTDDDKYDIQFKVDDGKYAESYLAGLYKRQDNKLINMNLSKGQRFDFEIEILDNNNLLITKTPDRRHLAKEFISYYFTRRAGSLKIQNYIENKKHEIIVSGENENIVIDRSKINSSVWISKRQGLHKHKKRNNAIARIILNGGNTSTPINVKTERLIKFEGPSINCIGDDVIKNKDFICMDMADTSDQLLEIEAKGYHKAELTIVPKNGFCFIGDIYLNAIGNKPIKLGEANDSFAQVANGVVAQIADEKTAQVADKVIKVPVRIPKAGIWLTDYKEAQGIAKKYQLPIIINFSGSDWCGWCIKLDKEVFQKSAFKDWAKKNAVLLLADSPRRKKLSSKLQKQNNALKAKYAVKGFPTVMLTEPNGTVIQKYGYVKGGASKYVGYLTSLLRPYTDKNPPIRFIEKTVSVNVVKSVGIIKKNLNLAEVSIDDKIKDVLKFASKTNPDWMQIKNNKIVPLWKNLEDIDGVFLLIKAFKPTTNNYLKVTGNIKFAGQGYFDKKLNKFCSVEGQFADDINSLIIQYSNYRYKFYKNGEKTYFYELNGMTINDPHFFIKGNIKTSESGNKKLSDI